jgi:nucleoside-diphosphate-sugar epimerase
MQVVITGGTGFLGLCVARALVKQGRLAGPGGTQAIDDIVLFDAAVPGALPPGLDGRVRMVAGDIADRDRVFSLIERDDVALFHLASVVSAGAERDFDGAMRVNLKGGRNVFEALRARMGTPRVVFASSVAVYGGDDLPEVVGDGTREAPQTTYGMTKAIGELMVNDYTRKGFLDGRAARLPTVIVRPGPANKAASGFASALFREPLAGRDYALPVRPETRIMVIGARSAVAGLIKLMEAEGRSLGHDRAVALPNRAYRAAEMIEVLRRVAREKGIALGAVRTEPDPAVEAIVGSWPLRMDSARALALGLAADQGLERIVLDYLEDHA